MIRKNIEEGRNKTPAKKNKVGKSLLFKYQIDVFFGVFSLGELGHEDGWIVEETIAWFLGVPLLPDRPPQVLQTHGAGRCLPLPAAMAAIAFHDPDDLALTNLVRGCRGGTSDSPRDPLRRVVHGHVVLQLGLLVPAVLAREIRLHQIDRALRHVVPHEVGRQPRLGLLVAEVDLERGAVGALGKRVEPALRRWPGAQPVPPAVRILRPNIARRVLLHLHAFSLLIFAPREPTPIGVVADGRHGG
mmetsp:Transcript_787/g.1602  ORF Transcript_787/g.1602 Transcript_787/m.1602 type:complete len:245 (+) Transcript_787:908-1642(+)